MHLKRWITAIVAIPFLALLVLKGGSRLFAIFICLVCILALWEYFGIVLNKAQSDSTFSFQLLAFFIGPVMIWAASIHSFRIILILFTLNLIISALISLKKFKTDPLVTEIVTKQVLGVVYIPLFLSFLVLIRNGTDGIAWIFFLLFIVFAGDIGAFYVGSMLGRHKLCPSISPGKTVEGSLGGIAANLGAGILYMYLFLPSLPWAPSILFFIAVGVVGQAGDLFESEFKRVGNIKDSGVILPGHGGMLDRIDALLFATPLAYIFKEYIV